MGFHGDSSMGTPIRDALNDLLVGWLIVVVPISSISCLASGLHLHPRRASAMTLFCDDERSNGVFQKIRDVFDAVLPLGLLCDSMAV